MRNVLVRLATADPQTASPFVITIYRALGNAVTPCCVTTLASEYSFKDLIKSIGLLQESDARFYISEVICGLEFIHANDLVHRDLKLANILLSQSGHALIVDFDMAFDCREDAKSDGILAGAYSIMAPEIANRIAVTKASDIWSLGCLIGQLVTPNFRPKSNDNQKLLKMAQEGMYNISNRKELSKELIDFIETCLRIEPSERPTVEQLKTLPFFQDLDWNKVSRCEIKPPIDFSQLTASEKKFDPYDAHLLSGVSSVFQPFIQKRGGTTPLKALLPFDKGQLERKGYSETIIQRLFRNFNFVNPNI